MADPQKDDPRRWMTREMQRNYVTAQQVLDNPSATEEQTSAAQRVKDRLVARASSRRQQASSS